jgi:hypothetical protein
MAERKAQMEARFEQKLAEKVKSGQLTEAQKAAIIAKRKEMADWAFARPTCLHGLKADRRSSLRRA